MRDQTGPSSIKKAATDPSADREIYRGNLLMEQLRLTTLKTANKRAIRKTVALLSDGSIKTLAAYPQVTNWTRQVHSLDHDIDALAAFLAELSTDPTACLVTGEPCGSIPLAAPARRRKNVEPGIPATLAECSAAWLPIDCDGIPITGKLDPLDPEPAIAEVVAMLGAPFASSSYGWALTAGAAPGAREIRCRIYFLLDRPITNEDRRRWALGLNAHVGIKIADPAIYNAAHPVYTAAPQFAGGRDPFPRRCGVVYGEEEILRWDSVPIHGTPAQGAYAGSEWAGRTPRSVAELLDSIGDHAGGLGFHEPITRAIFRMVADRWTEDRIIGTIRATIANANQSRHKRSEIERYLSLRYLRESIKGADRRIKIAANAPRATQTLRHSAPIPLEQAQRQIRDIASRWQRGEGPAKLVLATTVGSGKSTLAADVIREELPDNRTLLWAFPTHAQGEEILAKLNANGAPLAPLAVRVEGRVRNGAEDPLCHRPQVIEAVKAAGLARHTKSIACQRAGEKCPFLSDCAYYRQFRTGERVRLIPHALLPLEDSEAFGDQFLARCTGVVIDESPLSSLIGRKHYRLDAIEKAGPEIAALLKAWQAGEEVDPAEWLPRLEAEYKVLTGPEVPIHGPRGADEGELLAELRRLADRKAERWGALYRGGIARLSGDSNVLWFGSTPEGPTAFVAWKHSLPEGLDRVLILDATADTEVYRALLGDDVEVIRIDVEQTLEVIQATDAPVGKRRLESEESLLAQVAALTRMTGSALVTNKNALEKAQERDWLDGVPTAHFNALRGVNALEGCSSLVIAGRPEPDALSMEAMARALWPREALTLTGGYVWRSDGFGSVAAHDDARVDSLLRMHREAEVAQAIGRIRAVRSPTPKRVYLLTNTPVHGVAVRSSMLAEMLPSWKLSRLFLAGGGVAPLVPSLMAQLCPDVWPTEAAAKHWLSRERVSFCLGKILHKGNETLNFRTQGQRCPSRVLSALPLDQTRNRLEQITGKPIVSLAPIPDEPLIESAPTQAEDAHMTAKAPDNPAIFVEVITDDRTRFEALIHESELPAMKAAGRRRGMQVRRIWTKPAFSIRRHVAPPIVPAQYALEATL